MLDDCERCCMTYSNLKIIYKILLNNEDTENDDKKQSEYDSFSFLQQSIRKAKDQSLETFWYDDYCIFLFIEQPQYIPFQSISICGGFLL